MLVSNCCGKSGNILFNNYPAGKGGVTYQELEVCSDCKEYCEYVPQDYFNDMEQIKATAKAIHANYPTLDHVNPEYRKYHGQIKTNDND